MMFPGQGSQHSRMFHLLSKDEFGKQWLQHAGQILNIDLFDERAVAKALEDVIEVQCLIVILSVGVFRAIEQASQAVISFLSGYSLGEVSAFCVSVELGLADICALVKKRATCMQAAARDACNHQATGMAVLKGNINLDSLTVMTIAHDCYLAIINADDHFVIGGVAAHLDALIIEARAKGVTKACRLAVKLPSHTPLLTKASAQFDNYLHQMSFNPMRYPILNALTQEKIQNTQAMLPILAHELSQTLHWDRVMHISREYGIHQALELGPGFGLKKMARDLIPDSRAYSLDDYSSFEGFINFFNKNRG